MQIIAVTGRSGSGKSTAAAYIARQGYTVLDADEAARAVLKKGSPCIKELCKAFGEDIVDETGEVRRNLLAQRAFADATHTAQLTNITHPAIVRLLLNGAQEAENRGEQFVFVDGAVIIGGLFQAYCNKIIVVAAEEEASVQRIMKRDAISHEMAVQRLSRQLSNKEMLAAADYVIYNKGSLQALYDETQIILRQIVHED